MWYSEQTTDVLQKLNVNFNTGLSENEVRERLQEHGQNKIQGKKKKTVFQLFLAQLQDWLIYILFAAALITGFMGEYVDTVIIMLVIVINAVLGVIQEVKAGKAIEALQKISTPRALVRRAGIVKEVKAEDLVPGDVVILDAGRYVPADLRLIESASLKVEESALTGESVPVEKNAEALFDDPETPLGDRLNMAYMSTFITYGRGIAVVVDTGMKTEVGRIAKILDSEEEGQTPLEKRLDELGKTLGKVALGICLFIFLVSLWQGRNLTEMFLTSVSLAVASIPEGLAAIVAVVLSIGVTSMSKKNAIIKKLPAVETLGAVNIICSDKTGTLTKNQMTVTQCFTIDEELMLSDSKLSAEKKSVHLLAKAMALCNDATYEDENGTGDPTEIALLVMADRLGIDRKQMNRDTKRQNEYAFDSDRKLMSVLVEEQGEYTVYTKGALGSLLDICTHVIENDKATPATHSLISKFEESTENMSRKALRTLAVAYKKVPGFIEAEEMEHELTLIGVVGMIDPPREEVKASIELAKKAGVRTVMITGDNGSTAFAIAKELGIAENEDQTITAKDFVKIPENEFNERVAQLRVFARVSPEHKVKIVRGLKAGGNIVSMTGDGVNDAPSLTAADIGVAMGITGTDVAKGAADMILTDDNFTTIVSAIEEGRNIYDNIKNSVIFLLSSNLGEVVTMFVALLVGWQAPFIATQLLWINLLTDSLPAVALGMEKGDPDVMKEKPRSPDESFFAGGAGRHALMGGFLIGAITIFSFWYGYYEHGYTPGAANVPAFVLDYARTMAFMTLVISQLFYALGVRNARKPLYKTGLFSNMYLIGAVVLGVLLQLLVLYIPVLREAFKLQVLDGKGWLVAISLGFIPLSMAEIIKVIGKKKSK